MFGWIDGNILHGGLLEEMRAKEFALYGFYCLAGDNLYGMSCYTMSYIAKVLGVAKRDVVKVRNALVKRDLIAFENRELIGSKGLRYKKCVVQVLSLPFERIVGFRKRVKDESKLTPFEKGIRKYYLTTGFGRFLSEEEQDGLIVRIMRDEELDFEVRERIKEEIRKGKLRRTVYKV